MPNHIGFILDGNRRWAKAKGLPSVEGHKAGYDNLKAVAEECFNMNIKYVSAYIFSTENWGRSKSEVDYLMKLVLRFLKKDALKLAEKGVKIAWFGVKNNLSQDILKAIDYATELTKDNNRGVLGLCFNYGGHSEIVELVRSIVKLNPDSLILPITRTPLPEIILSRMHIVTHSYSPE